MDQNVPGSSNAPADGGDHFARNPDGTITHPQPADPSHVASVQTSAPAALKADEPKR